MTNLLNVGIQFRKFSASMMLTGLAALAGLMLSANVSLAQPTLKLRFAFDDGPSGTTTPSDTSGGGADVTLQMITGAGTASTNLHGAANSGVAALTNPNRCLNLSSNGSHGATGNYAGVTNANLGFGSVSSFVATMWMKESKGMSGNTLGHMFLLGNSTNTDVGTANSIGMKWQGPNQLYFFVNTVQCSMSFPQADTNGWIFPDGARAGGGQRGGVEVIRDGVEGQESEGAGATVRQDFQAVHALLGPADARMGGLGVLVLGVANEGEEEVVGLGGCDLCHAPSSSGAVPTEIASAKSHNCPQTTESGATVKQGFGLFLDLSDQRKWHPAAGKCPHD
jgi:hypothetical protein